MPSELAHFHTFQSDISKFSIPEKFTFPFCYEPVEIAKCAALELQEYLENQQDFEHNFGLSNKDDGSPIGKMFGVLVVEKACGAIGFLAAVSGKLAGTNQHHYFVPPVFDMLTKDSFFLLEEEKINALNRKIENLENSESLNEAKQKLQKIVEKYSNQLAAMRTLHKQNKAERKKIRSANQDSTQYEEIKEDLIKQSYRDQHHYDVLKKESKLAIERAQETVSALEAEIERLKQERKLMSSDLQQKLFDQYQFLNRLGEIKDVLSIFDEKLNIQPPAGAGECAAPKLLQYAYKHELKPLALAEFWWGQSPSLEVRKHKTYYPACRGKCEPILEHMLKGLQVDENPMATAAVAQGALEILHEDDDIIVVNKPAELLSVPGIQIKDSVQSKIMDLYPQLQEPIIIHRLDMSTSGLLILAKNKAAHQFIQNQFIEHTIQKRYSALLDGIIEQETGRIELPLRVDLDDRPRQVVCYTYGKNAITEYKVIAQKDQKTKVHFFPLTGRTHQLRVHAAHQLGLNTPIVGDDLYGKRSNRLHLHAGYIRFIHPSTKQSIEFELEDPF